MVGLTGAYSLSRTIVPGYAGSRYTDVSGAVSVLNDQSGATRDLTQGTAANRPAVVTVGDFLVADFDGTNDHLVGAAASNFIAVGAGYVAMSVIVKSIATNNAAIYDNDALFGDNGGYLGLHLKSGGPTVSAYNYDGSVDEAAAAIALSTKSVVEWIHTGGNVSVRVNGGAAVTVASGNTGALTGLLLFGANWPTPTEAAIQLFEAAIYSTVPSAGERDSIVAGFLAG